MTSAPAGILLQGAVFGSLTALLAVGMVLAYRSSRTINFAQAELGAVAAVITIYLATQRGWPYGSSVVAGLAVSTATAVAVEQVVVRRLREAPRLIVAVATIGVAQLLVGASVVLANQLAGDRPVATFHSPLTASFSLHPVVFSGDHIAAMVAVPVVLVGLGLFLYRSRYGVAVRAAADNADRAALLGVPTERLSTLVWAMAGLLSGLAVLLRLPLSGAVSFTMVTGSGISLLVRTLAAAVIARMDSLPRAAAAAIGLGICESVVAWNLGNATYVDAFLVVVILAALLVPRGGLSRAAESAPAMSRFRAVREVRPIPAELRDLREVRLAQHAIRAVLIGAAIGVPLLVPPSRQQLCAVILIYAVVAVSLVVLTGWAGQISLGHFALVGLGGTATFALYTSRGVDFFLALPFGMAVAAVISVVLGLPAVRVRGPFLAVTTLAFALSASSYLLQDQHFPWLVVERVDRPVLWGRLGLERDWQMYYLALTAFVAVALAATALRRSRTGRAMIAVRDNEAAAAVVSVSPAQVRLTAFAISGAIAGLAGALYVMHQNGLRSDAYTPEVSLRLFSMVVIGGLGSLSGAVLGAVYVRGAEFFLPPGWSLIATGAGIVALLLVAPGGLGEVVYRARDALLRKVAVRRGLLSTDPTAERAEPSAARSGSERGGRSLLDIRELEVSYSGVQVLFDVNLTVGEGEIVALLGTNGAGKSTVLRAVSGLLTPGRGSITFDRRPIHGLPPGRIARLGIIQVPGGRGIFPTLSVAENLTVAGWLRHADPALRDDIAELLDVFPPLRQRLHVPAGALSGGEQQMLSLAQAFLNRPRLLLIDELSLGLAPAVVDTLLHAVRTMADRGTTVVIVEQRVTTALRLARRAIFLDKGQVTFSGATAELLERPDVLHSVYLQGARAVAQGRRRERRDTSSTERAAPALALVGLTKRYGGVIAADAIDLSIEAGDIVGVIGPNGAGKTTVFDLISGLARQDSGRVLLSGVDVSCWPAHARARLGLGRSFQDARLWPSLTVEHALAVAFERHVAVRAALAAMLALPVSSEAEADIRRQVDELIDALGLGQFRNKFFAELSTGSRRIVELGALLAHRPDLLLLDEPSSGLAQKEVEALVPILSDLPARLGCTLVVIDHDTVLLSAVVNRLVALHLGRVIADGSPSEVLADARVADSFLAGHGSPAGV